MKIAKPLLLITTPLGLFGGLREAYRFNPGLAFLMFALILMIGAAVGMLVGTARREQMALRRAPQAGAVAESKLDNA